MEDKMVTKRTKLMEAYTNLIGDYLLDSMSIILVKEELEMSLDEDLTDEDFYNIIKENAKVYKVFLYKYKPDNFGYVICNGRKVGEISIEIKEGDEAIINDIRYY